MAGKPGVEKHPAQERTFTETEMRDNGIEQAALGRKDLALLLLQTQFPLGSPIGNVIADIRIDYGFITKNDIERAFAIARGAQPPPGDGKETPSG
jgi:hypothetical protein